MKRSTPWKGFRRWGNLPSLQLPTFMMKKGILDLSASEVRVLVVLLHLHRKKSMARRDGETVARVKVGQEAIARRTGYARAAVGLALRALEKAGYVQIVPDRAGSTKRGTVSSEYILTQPHNREPIRLKPGASNILGSLGMWYFQIPVCLLTSAAHWSMANLTGSEVRLYIAILWIANLEPSHVFERTNAELYHSAGLRLPTFKTALDGLQRHGLVFVSEGETSKTRAVQLCNPFTREPMGTADADAANDLANYTITDPDNSSRRLNWNEGTPDQWEQILRDALPAGEQPNKSSNGELMIRCPFKDERTPSCSVSLTKRCYRCFGCDCAGTLTGLLQKLNGGEMAETIRHISAGLGQQVEFNEPDSNAIAKYDYRDMKGYPVKQVLRFPNYADGRKHFSQRKWTDTGWLPTVKGVGAVLYNADRVVCAGTVIVVEGERDADSVTGLHLAGQGGETIGVTSGGKGSWDAKLAKQLRGHAVIMMPDNDAAGEEYANAVRASLDAQHINYVTVSFAGTGAKDVTDYLQSHTAGDLVGLIASDWIRLLGAQEPQCADDYVEA